MQVWRVHAILKQVASDVSSWAVLIVLFTCNPSRWLHPTQGNSLLRLKIHCWKVLMPAKNQGRQMLISVHKGIFLISGVHVEFLA